MWKVPKFMIRLTYYIKLFLNNESVCDFMVVQLFKLSTKDKSIIILIKGRNI